MLTSNVQLGYILTRGLGQAVQGGLSCPLPRSSERMDNQQFLLHHLLQKYLVITDINFISVNLRCSLQCRTPEREVRGSRPTAAVLCPWARHFTPWKYWLITQEAMAPSRHDWKIVDWDVKPQHNQPTKAHFKVSVGLRIDKGGGGGKLSRAVYPQILLHHLLQEYLVERDINIISINLRCSLQRFNWVMYWQGMGGKLSSADYLAPHPEFQRELTLRQG